MPVMVVQGSDLLSLYPSSLFQQVDSCSTRTVANSSYVFSNKQTLDSVTSESRVSSVTNRQSPDFVSSEACASLVTHEQS